MSLNSKKATQNDKSTDDKLIEAAKKAGDEKPSVHIGTVKSDSLDKAFDDIDFDKINEEFEQKHRPKPPILKPVPARIVGACVLFVVIAAIIFSVIGIKSAVETKKAENAKIEAICDYLSPVASLGIQPFENASELDAQTLLRCAAIYTLENNHSELQQSKSGRMELPVYMMKSSLYNLFGSGVELKYYSFDINGSLFEYDSENKCYLFSASGISSVYSPKIEAYSKSGSIVTARVKYVANNNEINAYNNLDFVYKIEQKNGESRIISISKG